jgi:prepilin-type N-terminal cleavage/methylation domain-containing protein
MKNNQSGFTLIETIVVVGIVLILFGFVGFNLIGVQRTTSINSTADVLLSDLSSQQTKAMMGAGAGASIGSSYGIYFRSNGYVLFKGTTYPASDPNNFIVSLDEGIAFTNITFPSSSIVFSAGSGTISGFLNNQNTIDIRDTQGVKTKTITVNRYGVVTSRD